MNPAQAIRIATLFGALLAAPSSLAQWVSTGGPVGGNITSFATLPGRIFAGTETGAVLQSTDGGLSWRFAAVSLTSLGVRSLAVLDTMLFAATGGVGVFRTVDYGIVWSPFNGGLTDLEVNALAANDSTLFAGTPTQGVFRWRNYGNWSHVFPAANVRALVASGPEIVVGAYGTGVFRSPDNGTSWSAANSGLTSLSVQALAYNGTLMLTGTTAGVFRSTNRGASWTSTNLTISTLSLVIAGNIQLAGTTMGRIYRSSDFGATWVQVFDATKQVLALSSHASAFFAGLQENGVLRSTDGGMQWAPANTGLSNTRILAIAALDPSVVCITSQYKVFRSSNNGIVWDDRTEAISSSSFASTAFATSNAFLVGTSFDLYGTIYRSTDGGISWASVLSAGGVYSLGGRGQNAFAGIQSYGPYRVYRSTNGGALWSVLGPNLFARAFTIFDSVLFAGNYRSSDNGLTWQPLTLVPTVISYAVHDSMIFAGTESAGAFRSTDQGDTWLNAGFQNNRVSAFVSRGKSLFAVAAGSLYRTTNNGATWVLVNEGLPTPTCIAATNTHMFAGTSFSGVWRRPLSEIVVNVQEDENPTPFAFALDQNYPNPFNSITRIAFSIRGSGGVTLKVYDILGREIATLMNDNLAPGTYTVEWNAEKHASGIYVVRLTAGRFSTARKLLLLR